MRALRKAFKNIFRKKGRGILTVFGISIGIFALVVMGSLSEKLNLLVKGGLEFYGSRITVQDPSQSDFFGTTPISISKLEQVRKVEGVKGAYATLAMMKDKDATPGFGVPPMINGIDPEEAKDETFKLSYQSGRGLKVGDSGVAVLGADLARDLKVKVGDQVTLRGEKFKLQGVLDKTFTAPDNSAMVPLPDAQKLFVGDIPAAYRATVNPSDLATSFEVFVKKGYDANQVTERINKEVSGVKALAPDTFKKQIQNNTRIFNFIILGSALIALVVGGLSIINTMIMSISERTREIGIKKAIGATNRRILREILLESSIIGLLGGLLGLALGWLTVLAINAASASQGQEVFLTTGRLAVGAVAFSVLLGAVAGFYPAWYAARLNPIDALRSK